MRQIAGDCNRSSTVCAVVVLAAVLAQPSTARASLGATADSVDADRVRIQGALTGIVRTEAYTRHELRSATGTTIREYVSPSGVVFAVTWQGPWQPNLRQVLGTYFDQYEQAQRTQPKRARGVVRIDRPDLVVVAGGHQRSFSGRAFVKSLTPPGVRIESLQ